MQSEWISLSGFAGSGQARSQAGSGWWKRKRCPLANGQPTMTTSSDGGLITALLAAVWLLPDYPGRILAFMAIAALYQATPAV